MVPSIILILASFLASAKAITHVIVQTDVVSQAVDVQATVYDGGSSIYTSGTATKLGKEVEITSYRSTYVTSAATATTTTVAPTTVAQVKAATTSSATAVAATTSSTSTVAAASTSAAAASSTLNSFQSVMLSEHNVKRALHQGVGSLTWSSTLEAYAQAYADKYSCPSNGALTHSGGDYGENLASGYSNKGTVDAWYDEIKQYNYNSPGFSESTGHFTQLIWKASTQLGCAYKNCDNEWGTYVVCEYYPMGNIVVTGDTSYWSQNVPPLK
ncbi:sterol-binding protein [Saccharomycopsis crataegensis]|uniref:Sterol-binding protein n=1 Tax=Saccharomycopsis crataegensis TaxID=43959 RepID=A0AAV5QP80_9ASCO|nr:sterol-binding protein [Saccharomycopsis crataegensis]